MILGKSFPPDIRVEKEAQSLIKAGHKLYLLAYSKKDKKKPPDEYINKIKVSRVPDIKMQLSLIKRIWEFVSFYKKFYYPYWINYIERFCKEFKIEVLHVHDLPLVSSGLQIAQKLNIPIIADLHENYAAGLRVWNRGHKLPLKKQIINRIIENANRWEKHEPKVLKDVDHIIVVTDETKQKLVDLGFSYEKISVVYNAESSEFWKKFRINKQIVNKYRDLFVVSYIGGFGPHRGLDCAIKAMKLVAKKTQDIELLLVGKDGWYGKIVDDLIDENSLSKFIEVVPKVPIKLIKSYLEITNVGIIPYNLNPQTNASAPHKLFQYIVFGKPVIVSNCTSLKRIIDEISGGLVFESGNPEDLANKILSLYESSKLRKKFSENMKKAGNIGKYTWNYQAKLLVKLYDNFK
ncbi:MAG: glycosyltransferase family 4 protein [Promethearchaeota archaeon]